MSADHLISAILATLLGVGITACSKDAGTSKPSSEPPKTFNPLPPSVPTPAPAVGPRPKREILVGGCMERCTDPKRALENFLTAVVSADVDAVRPFVNTAVLVHAGESHGERWAQQFMSGRGDERRADIDKWLKTWLTWVDRIEDPTDRMSPASGITVVELNQRRYVVDYRHPQLTPDLVARPLAHSWRLVLKPRGLEWLVAEIDDRRRP